MVYGVIDDASHRFYSYLSDIFPGIDNGQRNYNWLITDCYCNKDNPIWDEMEEKGYCWISGEALTQFAARDNTQWIGAVFSGFAKDIPLEEILEYPLPIWEHPGFWHNPLGLQHPLATLEIVPWDSSCTLLLSKNPKIIESYQRFYPKCLGLADYNNQQERRDPP